MHWKIAYYFLVAVHIALMIFSGLALPNITLLPRWMQVIALLVGVLTILSHLIYKRCILTDWHDYCKRQFDPSFVPNKNGFLASIFKGMPKWFPTAAIVVLVLYALCRMLWSP